MCIRNILYVSYDGLTDPVADSQVIPYLIELTKRGHRILILSFEKPAKEALIAGVSEKLAPYGIEWIRTRYTKKPPVISTVRD
ncbi:MAG: glycosyltransferase, partial [Marinilabiliales bacterium]